MIVSIQGCYTIYTANMAEHKREGGGGGEGKFKNRLAVKFVCLFFFLTKFEELDNL